VGRTRVGEGRASNVRVVTANEAGILAQIVATFFIAAAVALTELARKGIDGVLGLATTTIISGVLALASPLLVMFAGRIDGWVVIFMCFFTGLFVVSTSWTLWSAVFAHSRNPG